MASKLAPPPSDDDPTAPETIAVDSSSTTETGKLRMMVDLLKRSLGVKDLAAMRLSLPAVLLEPVPNLDYWSYLDRPDLFAAINDSPEPLHRILAVLRFAFSKELKFIRHKICKPYNSVLGEHFRCHYDVLPVIYPDSDTAAAPVQRDHLFAEDTPAPASESKGRFGWSPFGSRTTSSASTPGANGHTSNGDTLEVEGNLAAGMSELSLNTLNALATPPPGHTVPDAADVQHEALRVVYLTEQVSHHPPISVFHARCPARGVEAVGVDQIAARVSGTTVRISSGDRNKGIFIRLTAGHGAGEAYRITHPVAQVNGILRGAFYATVSDSITVTCRGGSPGTRYRAVIEYKEESWLGKPQFLLEGVIHTIEDEDDDVLPEDGASEERWRRVVGENGERPAREHDAWTKIKHVPRARVVAEIEGCWKKTIRWRPVDSSGEPGEWRTLLDLTGLDVVPKRVRPIATQGAFESRRLWARLTAALLRKEYSEASRVKVAIEQAQRDRAAERKRKGEEFMPVFFEKDLRCGWSELTPIGRTTLEEEIALQLAPGEENDGDVTTTLTA